MTWIEVRGQIHTSVKRTYFDHVACFRVLCLATKSETVMLEIHHSRVPDAQ